VVLVMVVTASASAGPCIICAGCGGGWVRTGGAPPTAEAPCAQLVVRIPCCGEPYFTP
jgi:hypothetical protein